MIRSGHYSESLIKKGARRVLSFQELECVKQVPVESPFIHPDEGYKEAQAPFERLGFNLLQ